MNIGFEIPKNKVVWYRGYKYLPLNDDFNNTYNPTQYCTVIAKIDNDNESLSNALPMSSSSDMEILNLPEEHFKNTSMKFLIKEIMASYKDCHEPFDGDFVRAFYAVVIDIAHRMMSIAMDYEASINNIETGSISFDMKPTFYIRNNTSIKELGYDTGDVESVFEFDCQDKSIILFTLDPTKCIESIQSVFIIINN